MNSNKTIVLLLAVAFGGFGFSTYSTYKMTPVVAGDLSIGLSGEGPTHASKTAQPVGLTDRNQMVRQSAQTARQQQTVYGRGSSGSNTIKMEVFTSQKPISHVRDTIGMNRSAYPRINRRHS